MGGKHFRTAALTVVAGLVATSCSWTMVGHDGGHSFSSPADGSVTTASVSGLHQLWQGTGTAGSVPVAGDGRVFTVQKNGTGTALAAYPANGCGASPCAPTWTQPAGGTPLLLDGRVVADQESADLIPNCPFPQYACYAAQQTGGAFDPATGAPTDGAANTAYQYPVVADGVLYHWSLYTPNQRPPWPPALWRLDETKLDGSGTTSRIDQFQMPVPYAVADGSIYLELGQQVLAFMAGTVNGCGQMLGCHPTWTGDVAHPGPWDGVLTVANGLVYVSDLSGGVEAFDANGCGSPDCAPLWTARAGTVHVGQVAVTDTTLFVPSDDGHLYAFPARGCGAASCAPRWTVPLGSAVHAPTVAGSVLYVGTQDGRLVAIDARGCGSSSCPPLATVAVGSPVRTPIAISNGKVFLTADDGTLRAFGVG